MAPTLQYRLLNSELSLTSLKSSCVTLYFPTSSIISKCKINISKKTKLYHSYSFALNPIKSTGWIKNIWLLRGGKNWQGHLGTTKIAMFQLNPVSPTVNSLFPIGIVVIRGCCLGVIRHIFRFGHFKLQRWSSDEA